jgi:mannose-6-phosphate isomerase-like protein (cupin superfamily)
MQAVELEEILAQMDGSTQRWLEFLRVPALSLGIYRLPAGAEDGQSPHTEDEIYYVLSGQARIRVAGEDRAVQSGSIVYVGAHVDHYFHTIEEDLTTLVLFAPAEGSLAAQEAGE